jgi:hypothetical protein
MGWREEISAALPPLRGDEPKGLQRDILDELRDKNDGFSRFVFSYGCLCKPECFFESIVADILTLSMSYTPSMLSTGSTIHDLSIFRGYLDKIGVGRR